MSKSCTVYYDNDNYLVSFDGKVYKNGNYDVEVYSFYIPDFVLTGVVKAWMSPFGNFILYQLTNKRLASFPLGLGYPCALVYTTFSSVFDVTWDRYSDRFAVRSDQGVTIFNYKLGVLSAFASYTYLFFTALGELYLDTSGNFTLSVNQGEQFLTYSLNNIYLTGGLKHDLTTDRIYYINSVKSELCSVLFKVDDTGLVSDIVCYGIFDVSEIIDINSTYVFIRCADQFKIITVNGGIVGTYDYMSADSYGIIYHMYTALERITYYTLKYIFFNDLVWCSELSWIKLGTKTEGLVRGNRYVQFKVVLHSDAYNTVSPLLNSIYVGSPVRVGPILPNETKKFYVSLDLPKTDTSDVFATKIVSYFETLVFADV